MSKQREALEAALEVLEQLQGGCTDSDDGTVEVLTVWCPEIIEQIQAALAEPEQEPVIMHKVAEERDKLMQMVQEYASTWAIAGGRFDDGSAFEVAKKSKDSIFRQTAKLATISFELGFEKEREGAPLPQPREWQELSDDEKNKLYLEDSFCAMRADWDEEYNAISAALRAKNEVKA